MSKKIYRTCLCCGKPYEYCNHCGKDMEPWKNLYDSIECKEVMNAVSAYNAGLADAEQIKAVLNKYNVTDYSKYKGSINAVLEAISSPKKSAEPKKKVSDTYTETVPSVEDTSAAEESFSDEVVEEAPKRRSTYNSNRKPWKNNYYNSNSERTSY